MNMTRSTTGQRQRKWLCFGTVNINLYRLPAIVAVYWHNNDRQLLCTKYKRLCFNYSQGHYQCWYSINGTNLTFYPSRNANFGHSPPYLYSGHMIQRSRDTTCLQPAKHVLNRALWLVQQLKSRVLYDRRRIRDGPMKCFVASVPWMAVVAVSFGDPNTNVWVWGSRDCHVLGQLFRNPPPRKPVMFWLYEKWNWTLFLLRCTGKGLISVYINFISGTLGNVWLLIKKTYP